jgi:hypothetical protein
MEKSGTILYKTTFYRISALVIFMLGSGDSGEFARNKSLNSIFFRPLAD